jgi:acyl-CoA reductase-like NAD-dependent aldehyde dehydrogenase
LLALRRFGRLINTRAHQRVADILKQDKEFIVFGGDSDESDRYVGPTILDFGTSQQKFLECVILHIFLFICLFF